MAAHDRLQAYLAAHLTVDGRITAESSASPYGDLVNIVEMLPDVLAEHAAEREARERAERDVARLRDDFTPCDDCDGSGIGPLVVDRTGQTGDEPCSVCGGMGGLQKSAAQWIAKWHEATTTWKSKAHEQKARADRAEAEAKRLREALSALLNAASAALMGRTGIALGPKREALAVAATRAADALADPASLAGQRALSPAAPAPSVGPDLRGGLLRLTLRVVEGPVYESEFGDFGSPEIAAEAFAIRVENKTGKAPYVVGICTLMADKNFGDEVLYSTYRVDNGRMVAARVATPPTTTGESEGGR